MPVRETHRSLPETWKYFDPSVFSMNDPVVFHNPRTHRWERGTVTQVPVFDRDNRRIFLNNIAGGMELEIPPKRVDPKILTGVINLKIEDEFGVHNDVPYQVSVDASLNPIWNIGPDGEIEVTLVTASTMVAPNRKEISNVNLESLRSVQEIEQAESDINVHLGVLRGRINTINDIRRKELLAKVNELENEVNKMVQQMGHFDELGDIDEGKIREIAKSVKDLRNVADDKLRDLEKNLNDLEAEIAARGTGDVARKRAAEGLSGRIEGTQTDATDAWTKYEEDQEKIRLHRIWEDDINPAVAGSWAQRRDARLAEIVTWVADEAAAAAAGRRFTRRRPADFTEKRPDEPPRPAAPPVARPTYSKEKAVNAFRIIREMLTPGPHALPAIPAHPAVDTYAAHRWLITETNRKLTEKKNREGVVGDYRPLALEQRITGEIFLQLLEEWKNKTEITEPEAFNFNKEKTGLETKMKELREEFDRLVLANPRFTTTTNIRDHFVTLGTYNKTTPDVERLLGNLWTLVSAIEVELFKEKQRTEGRSEQDKEIDVDLPPNVLMEILRTRPGAVHEVMRQAYEIETYRRDASGQVTTEKNPVSAIEESLRQMFEPSPTQTRGRNAGGNLIPNEHMIARLRQYGIKDWRHFKKLWDEKLAPKAAELMHGWAQDDVRGEMARNASSWDTIRALGWQLGARIATNIALVGGAALGVSALWATGGLAGVALAGAAAGGVRAGLQKFLFGSKWLEDRKKKQLEALALRQRNEAIENLLVRRFGANHAAAPVMNDECTRMFTAVLATAAREASKDFVKDADAEGFGLEGDARRLYIQAIKDIKLGGDVPSAEQKMKCAVAIKRLMERTAVSVQEAAQGDPLVIRMLDGVMQGYSGTNASKENYGVKGAVGTVVAGSAASLAFCADQWWARAALGGLGGAAAGYHWGEGRRARQEKEHARGQTVALYEQSHVVLLRVLRALDTRRGTATRADLDNLIASVQLFNRLLDNKFESVAEQRMAAILAGDETLRKQVEDLIYQTYRRGVFAARALGTLEEHVREVERNSPVVAGSTAAWWSKTLQRAGYTVGGALAGAGAAILAGLAFKEIKELAGLNTPPPPPAGGGKGAAAAGGAVAGAAGAEHVAHAGGAGAHDVAPTGKGGGVPVNEVQAGARGAGAEAMHEVTVNHSPDYVAKSVDVYNIKQGGSAWGAIDHIHKSAGSKELFAGWSNDKFADWRHDELTRLGYKFLPDGKVASPYMIHPGAQMESYIGGDGQPHVRLVGLDTGKVKILDNYIVQEPGKGTDIHVPGPKAEEVVSSFKSDADDFVKAWGKGKGPLQMINDLPPNQAAKISSGGLVENITKVTPEGNSGLVRVEIQDGRSVLVHPVLEKDGLWHLHSARGVPSVDAITNSRGTWHGHTGVYNEIQHGGHKYYSIPGELEGHKGTFNALYNENGKLVGHSPDGKHVLLYAPETRYSAAYPVGTPDHIDIKPGSGGGFSQTNMNVDKSHLSDVLSGKGHPETTMVKGGAGAAEAVGGKGTAGGGEVPEAKPAVWDAHLTKAEVAEYQSLVKGVGPIMKNDLTDLIHNPNHVCNDPSALQKFVSKDIERAVAEAVKGIGKGDVSFELGQALSPGQSMPLESHLDLVKGALFDQLSPESKLFLAGGGSDYAMPVTTWGDAATPVFVAPGDGSHLLAVELPSGKVEFVYDQGHTFYADGPGQQLIADNGNGVTYPVRLEPIPGGGFSIARP